MKARDRIMPDTNKATGKGGALRVILTQRPNVSRPSRLAAGMQFTANRQTIDRERKGRSPKPETQEVLRLIVHGTCDTLAGKSAFLTSRSTCPCCGHKTGKLRLAGNKGYRLIALRNRKAERDAKRGA